MASTDRLSLRRLWAPALALAFATVTLAAACSSAPPPPPPAGAAGKHVDQATAGAITGHVALEGTPPAPDVIRVGLDQVCAQTVGANVQSQAVLVGKDGSVQNAFVYVKDGLDPSYTFDVPTTPVTLDQKGCRYEPRIFGVRAGQPVEVVNND